MSLFNRNKNQIRCPKCNSRKVDSATKKGVYTVSHPSTERKIKVFLLQLGGAIAGNLIGGNLGNYVSWGSGNYDTNTYEYKEYTYIEHVCRKCGHKWKN